MTRIDDYIQKIKNILWAGFLISLPVTNFRYFPGNIGGSKVQVRPLLVIPMAILLLLSIPRLWNKKLPRFFLPLMIFFFFIIISTGLPFVLGLTSELGEITYSGRLMRTIITLVLALGIYVTVSITPLDKGDLKFTIKWLYVGLGIAIFWGTLQTIFVLDLVPGWYRIMSSIQAHITINTGTPDRIMGLTLEPSWFADQISALWLPWVLPAAIQNRTVFNKRWKWITVERVLLVWMLVVLLFTLSRAGFVVALVVIGSGILLFLPKNERKIENKQKNKWLNQISQIYNKVPRFVRYAVVAIILLAGISVLTYYIGKDNKYINRMWLYWTNYSSLADAVGTRSIGGFFRYIGFGPRFVYWETAYRMFLDNPIFGVGLGNYTFHFQNSLPSIHVGYVPEILTRIVPDHIRVVTPKNYFARLLAETGIMGTGAFVTFLVTLTSGGLYLWLSKDPEIKFWGAGALLGMIAFLVDTFSYDSIAIPNPWVVFGLITAAYTVYTKKISTVGEN